MNRYELDRLGWYNFEWLVQILLKAEFGYKVESWGAHRDHGRDAYSKEEMVSRNGATTYRGPVIIQAKFVSQANAVGSKPQKPLRAACQAEAQSIRGRVRAGVWEDPRSYILITNCPLSGDDRAELLGIFSQVTRAEVYLQGSNDLADILDLNQEVTRAFPQILSYRNLLTIIQASQNKRILERSAAALAGAEQIIPIFVPTSAYERAWGVARRHSFVVLTGPPEMGKSSIGWMVAMAQLANGWQVIECREPDDVFESYDSSSKQVFLADDAFGRTEFSATRGDKWESDLAQILQRVDNSHWLIWTSRKHILERAITEMDLQGKAREYPRPAEVLVQADRLSAREKALILYRHAAHEGLGNDAKSILKANLSAIVNDRHFTPERIRRFVTKVLPDLARRQAADALTPDEIAIEVERAVEHYTDMMEKSLLKLSVEQQWILVCLLARIIHEGGKSEGQLCYKHVV